MYFDAISEAAPLICKRHAAIGGVGPDALRMKFMITVQSKLSPSMIFNAAKIPEFVRDLEMRDEHFIYLLDIYSELSATLFPNKEKFDALVEEYAFSFGHCGDLGGEGTALRKYGAGLDKVIPTSDEVRKAITENPWLIALHSITTWVLPIEVKRPK